MTVLKSSPCPSLCALESLFGTISWEQASVRFGDDNAAAPVQARRLTEILGAVVVVAVTYGDCPCGRGRSTTGFNHGAAKRLMPM